MYVRNFILFAAAMVAFAASAARIGIVSDTHLGWKETDGRLEQCYRLFKAQKVDRIVNLGDICEYHNPDWYRQYVEIREKVYPEGAPAEVYVFATHDRMKVKIPKGDRENALAFEKMKPVLKVAAGGLGFASTTALAGLDVEFAAGTRLVASATPDDPTFAAKGLVLGESISCLATIAAGAKWNGGDVYVMPTVAGAAVGAVIDGIAPGIPVSETEIERQLFSLRSTPQRRGQRLQIIAC